MTPRTIFFDVDGVLVHGYHSNPERVVPWDKNLLADFGIDPDRFRREFIFDVFVKKVIVGKMSLIDALERALPALGYKGSPMVMAQYWLSQDSNLNHELLDAIRQIREQHNVRLFIATNQEHLRAMWLWNNLGLRNLFDDIFYSARLGVRKPDPAYFKQIEIRVGPMEEPPLFFDDTPAVISAARSFGWDAVAYDQVSDFTYHPAISGMLSGI